MRATSPNTICFARDNELELAVRGGGHSLAGHGTVDGGIVLDLADMRGLHIDPDARVAWAQPGLTAIEFTEAAAAHGLATPFGDTGSVGIAGLTLGGGVGWLVRKHGLTIDALIAVEIVTADGRQLIASETEHPDLFWAVRGGGGNFGVVTRFQYRLYPVGMILGGAVLLPPTADVLRGLVPVAAAAPRELSTITFVLNAAPPLPFLAPEHHFKPAVIVMFVFDGDPEAGQAALEPFRRLATPLGELAAPMPYPGIYQFTAEGSKPGAGTMRSAFLDTLDDEAVDTILREMAAAPGHGMDFTQIRVLGGAVADVPADATAFAHRDATVMLSMHAAHGDDRAAADAWANRYFAAIAAEGERRLLELPRGRGRCPRPRRLPGRHLRAPGRRQAPLRPVEPVPPQPEHSPALTVDPRRQRRPAGRSAWTGRLRGFVRIALARSAPAIASRWAGVLPQHAPITVAPRARNETASVAIVSGGVWYSARAPTNTGIPMFGLATSGRSGATARIRSMTGRISSGPFPQLPPIASTPSALSARAASSGETPIIVWPRVSNVIVATTGVAGEARRAPAIAAAISARSDIVSIQNRSAPPAARAPACSANTSIAASRSRVPSGAMISPLGPMSPATSASTPAAVTSARSRIAAVRLSCSTRSSSRCRASRRRLAPNVFVRRIRDPASR